MEGRKRKGKPYKREYRYTRDIIERRIARYQDSKAQGKESKRTREKGRTKETRGKDDRNKLEGNKLEGRNGEGKTGENENTMANRKRLSDRKKHNGSTTAKSKLASKERKTRQRKAS